MAKQYYEERPESNVTNLFHSQFVIISITINSNNSIFVVIVVIVVIVVTALIVTTFISLTTFCFSQD